MSERAPAWQLERVLLGGLLVDPSQVAAVREILDGTAFSRADHQALWDLIGALDERRTPPDLALVIEEVAQRGGEAFGGVAYVAELPSACPSTLLLREYAAKLVDVDLRRRLRAAARQIESDVRAGELDTATLLDRAETAVMGVARMARAADWHLVDPVVAEHVAEIERRAQHPGAVTGISTGFGDLDALLAGLHRATLTIVAARPAMGKTMLALNMARRAAETGSVGIFSLEMSRRELVGRLLSAEGRVDAGRMRTGQMREEDWRRLAQASAAVRPLPIHIDDQAGLTIGELRGKARRLKAQHPDLHLIVVDYLQLMAGGSGRENREQVIAQISRGLKVLSKELDLAVVALSQLNRSCEARPNKRPMPSDLRESGAIEQDADVIAFIYRDEVYNPDTADRGIAEVIVAKQRAGNTGTVKLAFQGQFGAFAGLAPTREYS